MNATTSPATGMHLDDSSCADLVLDLLPALAREAALDHAASCPQCEARLRAHVAAGDRARADWIERGDLRGGGARGSGDPGAHSEHDALAGNVTELPRPWFHARSTRGWALAIAAALAVAVALPMLLSRPLERGPAHFLPPLGEEVRTREGETEDPHMTAGLEAYGARDLATSDRELSLARGEGAGEQLRRLYLANVRDQRGDARSALELLRGLQWRNLPEPWRHDGVVLYARVLRANGHAATADSIETALRSLPPGTPFVP